VLPKRPDCLRLKKDEEMNPAGLPPAGFEQQNEVHHENYQARPRGGQQAVSVREHAPADDSPRFPRQDSALVAAAVTQEGPCSGPKALQARPVLE
jgi:hypothetical protein